ncbi:MAG: D-amino acid dehydrogenase [Gammaproteobacteria bacterium]
MRVIVLGGGVIGVTTAYYLAKAGHEVTVLERQSGPALETSFANAGEISPGYAAPWAAPGIPLKALKWLFMKYRPLVVWPRLDWQMWRWGLHMLANCTAERYRINKGRMLPVAGYSHDLLRELRRDTGIAYDERARGTLQLFRTPQQVDGAAQDMAILNDYGVAHELLDAERCIQAEPALARVRGLIAGGLRLPGDETGDCFQFTQALARLAADLGVEFRYGVRIIGLETDGNTLNGVATEHDRVTGDAYVMALGSYSPLMLRPLGIDIPVYPVKGYSITVPIIDEQGAPVSTVMDESYKVAVTRLGTRIRAAGTAELAGYSLKLRAPRRATILKSVRDLFPHGGDLDQVQFWTGLRPMTPDGPPLIGTTPLARLYLNTGHGTLGWTMACGSGRVLADLISQRKPDIDISGLTLDRYR